LDQNGGEKKMVRKQFLYSILLGIFLLIAVFLASPLIRSDVPQTICDGNVCYTENQYGKILIENELSKGIITHEHILNFTVTNAGDYDVAFQLDSEVDELIYGKEIYYWTNYSHTKQIKHSVEREYSYINNQSEEIFYNQTDFWHENQTINYFDWKNVGGSLNSQENQCYPQAPFFYNS